MNGKHVHRLADMIGSRQVETPDGRGVPEPFYPGLFGRIQAAWEVVCGRAHAIEWPKSGDLEKALRP